MKRATLIAALTTAALSIGMFAGPASAEPDSPPSARSSAQASAEPSAQAAESREGWCAKDEGLSVVVDFGADSARGFEVRCLVGGDWGADQPGTDGRITPLQLVGYEVRTCCGGLVNYIDDVGNPTSSPQWWRYTFVADDSAWSDGTWQVPAEVLINSFVGVCYSAAGCLPRVDPQYGAVGPTDPVTTPTALELRAPQSVTVARGGSVTVAVTPATTTGAVTLDGLPHGPLTADLVGGIATFAVPAGLTASTYSLTARYAGDEAHDASTAAAVSLAVVRDGATVAVVAPTSAAYGTPAQVAVTVTSAGGTPTGSVTLAGAGPDLTQPLTAGRAVFTLPVDLAVGAYPLTATYLGSTAIGSTSSTPTVLTVGQGTTSRPALEVKRKATTTTRGKVHVEIDTVPGLTPATGQVVVELRRRKAVRTVKATLRDGARTIRLPRLGTGLWKVTVTYAGSDAYAGDASKTYRIRVR
jgi:hypothetical protein